MPNPFQVSPSGTTKLVQASTASVAATQVCTGGEQGMQLTNNSSVGVFVVIGSSSIVAAVPSTSAPGTGLCLPANTSRVFWVPGGPNNGWVNAIGNVTLFTAKVFATPGFGGI